MLIAIPTMRMITPRTPGPTTSGFDKLAEYLTPLDFAMRATAPPMMIRTMPTIATISPILELFGFVVDWVKISLLPAYCELAMRSMVISGFRVCLSQRG